MDLLEEVLRKKALDDDYLKDLEDAINKSFPEKIPTLPEQVKQIIRGYEGGQLVLVLGAGVSVEYGLPNWNFLLQNFLLNSFKTKTKLAADKSIVLAKLFTKLFSPNPLIAARLLRNLYQKGNNNETSFDSAVHDELYNYLDKEKTSDTLNEIVQLCVAPGKSPNLNSIITFNYDDILETHLSKLGIKVLYKTVSQVGQRPTTGELPIYHVHGFLPREGEVVKENKITLSEDIYHEQYNDTYSWNNIVQLSKYIDCVCLFIGLSLRDPNLRRLLDIARIQRGGSTPVHYLIREKIDPSKFEEIISESLKQNPGLLDKRAHIKPQDSAGRLARIMEIFKTQDDLSFGISTIWIDKYKEIPDILRQIYKKTGPSGYSI